MDDEDVEDDDADDEVDDDVVMAGGGSGETLERGRDKNSIARAPPLPGRGGRPG